MNEMARLWRCFVAVSCALLLVAGCGDDDDDNGDGQEQTAASFATYNAGLARGFVDYASARTGPLSDAVAELDTDVVCMQEVWLYEDGQGEWSTGQIDAVVDASQESFPHSYYEITEDSGDDVPNCNEDDTTEVESCVAENCADVPSENLAGCALSECGAEFNSLSSGCQQCVAANIGGGIDEIIDACTGDVGGSAYSYNGHNGLLLLSEHELSNTEFMALDSELIQRAVLHATANIPDFGEVDLYCTHLQADLSGSIPYPEDSDYGSYEEEQAAQINAINDYIEQTAQTDNVVLMGDMNNGPAVGDLAAQAPENYAQLTDAGFTNPYLEQDDPLCTYCGSNTLNDGDAQRAIDHVLIDFASEVDVVSTQRILDQTRAISTEDGELDLHLSDHFGVETTLQMR